MGDHPDHPDHPIHAGLPRAWMTPKIEVYTHARGPAEELTVLSWAADPATETRWPIEWTVGFGKGRVYNSTFGHVWRNESDPPAMRCAGFRTVLVRAVQWLAGRPVDFPVPADFPTETETRLRCGGRMCGWLNGRAQLIDKGNGPVIIRRHGQAIDSRPHGRFTPDRLVIFPPHRRRPGGMHTLPRVIGLRHFNNLWQAPHARAGKR